MAFPTDKTEAVDNVTDVLAAHLNNLEDKVGVDSSADTGSLDYQVNHIDHTEISNIGTNTHAQIDTHLGSSSNPHSVTAAQASAIPDTDAPTGDIVGTTDTQTLTNKTIDGYRKQIDASSGTSTTYGSLTGLVNGSNTSYTVSQSEYLSGSLEVYLNGQLQTQGSAEDWTETTPGSGTFTFATAPESGDIIIVKYRY